MTEWSFLTSHARVLLWIAHDPGVRLRDIAARTGVTERTAYGIVTDLTEAGYVVKHKDGRRDRYQIQAHLPLPESCTHPASQSGGPHAKPTRRAAQPVQWARQPGGTIDLRTRDAPLHRCGQLQCVGSEAGEPGRCAARLWARKTVLADEGRPRRRRLG